MNLRRREAFENIEYYQEEKSTLYDVRMMMERANILMIDEPTNPLRFRVNSSI
jgi:ATPase subunit of ABC transporter with duplicated ATPase domains